MFAADELTSADTVTGGSAIDTLYFLTPGEVAATAFANVTNIEGLGLDPGGNTVTLTDSLVAGSSIGSFRVGGGAGADIVHASAITNATPITFATGSGANNLKGGNGFDVFLVPDSTFADIDGNDGFDRITATTAAQSLDLTANATKIHDIEIIDLASSAGATLTLTAADIGQINPGAGTSLYVLGGADDTVSTDGGWTLITTTHTNPSVAPGNFTQLQHSSGRNLFLQNGIEVNDAPTVVVDSGAETIFTLEDQSLEICNTTFGDVDAGSHAVAVTFAATRGTLSALDTVGDGDGVRVGGIGTSTLTLTGSVADINAFVLADNVVYTPLSNDSGDVTLTTTIDDQGQVGAGGPLSASVNRTITIVPVVDGADVRAGAGFLQPTIGVEDPLNGFAFSTLNYRFAPPGNLDETDPRTFALDDGGFVMVWTQSTGTPGILVQRFGANGNPEDSIIAVSPTAAPGDNEPDVAALPNGGFAVAWVETPGDDGASDIEVAVYGNAGPLPTARFTVQSAAAGTAERNPTVTALTDGNLLVTWAVPTGSGTAPSELYAQRFTAAGVEVDASPALISATAAHATPVPVGLSSELYPGDPPAEQTVAALAGGAYAIAWVEAANGGQIHVETFGSNGLSSHAPVVLDLGVGTSTASFIPEREPDITLLDNGNFLVTWTASPSPPVKASADIMGQLFEPDGDALGTPQVLVLGSDGGGFDFTEFSPSVTALENGRFALSWLRLAGNNGDVFIQAFNNDGTRDDDGSINGADVQITANNQTVPNRDPIVTALDDGRFLLSWVSPKTDPSSSPLAPDNTGSQDDILYVIVEPGTGQNLTTTGNLDIELPTKVTLFDNDGSEILQSVTIEGLPDDYTLEFGAFDPFAGSGINTDPGAWVINRSDSTAAADFLDRLVAGTDALTLIANPDPDFVTDFALMITATVSEAGSTPPTNNSWPIFVNFGISNTTFYTGIGGGDVV